MIAEFLRDEQDRLNARRDHLEKLKILQRVFPPKYYNSERRDDGRPPPDNFEVGTISFTYIVSPSGRVVNLKHLETQPREIDDFDKVIGRSLRRLMYRPRLQDGVAVATGDVVFTHEFYYRPSDISGLPTPPEEEVQPESVTQEDTSGD